MTEAERTRLHTALALAWLWHIRGSRSLAVEAEAESNLTFFGTTGSASSRVDIIGTNKTPQRLVVDVVEVKGHRKDWKRERVTDKGSKWLKSSASPWALWLFVSADITDLDLVDLPTWWGIARANPSADDVQVLRTPLRNTGIQTPDWQSGKLDVAPGRNPLRDWAAGMSVLQECGVRSITNSLPPMNRAKMSGVDRQLRVSADAILEWNII
jgi:hypothetical protein